MESELSRLQTPWSSPQSTSQRKKIEALFIRQAWRSGFIRVRPLRMRVQSVPHLDLVR
ncbi:hypothetical protein SynMVIR181_02922 [Synechococcus sp. MVIR-18-1]|nr:hypothetical protein SynMVIR181_02922 [Synechococcus sp. MVIR-18-1]